MSVPQKSARRQHFDEDLPEDVEAVLDVAAILQIREFDLFHVAYRWFYGHASNEDQIERHFVLYMFKSVVPHWVRQFTRAALDLHAEGRLDPSKFGIDRLPAATPQSVASGLRYTVILVSTVALLVLMAEASSKLFNLKCVLPPCY
ncbi:MAG: hypothetical protein OEQ18_17940 [Gammaproteobacteria bacterium]|nr:hypothetical protein [Gammaproteobacteria bacterium]